MSVIHITSRHFYPDDLRGELIAVLILGQPTVAGAHFHTHPNEPLQVATSRYPAGHAIPLHTHPARQRPAFNGAGQEVFVLQRGRLLVQFVDSEGRDAGQWTLCAGDVALIVGGGHAFEMVEEVELVEVKVGPYSPTLDKVRVEEVASHA